MAGLDTYFLFCSFFLIQPSHVFQVLFNYAVFLETDAFNIQREYFISCTNILFVVFSGPHSQNMLVIASEDHFIILEPEAIQLLNSFLFFSVKLT